MKHSMVFKFLVILLTSLSIITAIAGSLGIIAMENADLYVGDLSNLQNVEYESISQVVADVCTDYYVVNTYGKIPNLLFQKLYKNPYKRSDAGSWFVRIQQDGQEVSTLGDPGGNVVFQKTFTIRTEFPVADAPLEALPEGLFPEGTESDSLPVSYQRRATEILWDGSHRFDYTLYYYDTPEFTVTVSLQKDVLLNSKLQILTAMFPYRYAFIVVLTVSLLLFAIGISLLCWSAGRAADGTIAPGGLNRMPLDIYALLLGILIVALVMAFRKLSSWIGNAGPHFGNLSLIGSVLIGICVLALALIIACAAQAKMGNNFLWKHMLIGRLLILLWRFLRFSGRGLARLARLLPVMWLWLLSAILLSSGAGVLFFLAKNFGGIFVALLIIDVAACLGFLLYCGYAIGSLTAGIRQMCGGDLQHKVSTKYLRGSFLTLAQHLNGLSATAMMAAENQTRSERMKSELITNISHDIKTPLTSIINFVDLLQKAPSEQDHEEYLQVLSRQSARMKKLIEDLMELSKANSGNITANLTTLDAAESVNQALGEFSDKFAAAQIDPVFETPAAPFIILADGRLLWRVLSNLMSNAVKYAMPGTRLYIELTETDSEVHLSLKNISREPLLIDSDELMDRFVRGDMARSSEGSGLGLNIAKSLMEIQNGQLQLLLDGDLFKVMLIFPKES